MINPGFIILIKREVMRFLALWKQTIMPGLISSALYIIVFGQALGDRIGNPIKNNSDVGYLEFIIPGLAMMSVINMAYQNSSSSIMQAKFLKFIEDILIAPLSGFEISMAFTIGGMIRGVINGILILIFSTLLINYYLDDPNTTFQIYNYPLTLVYLVIVSWAFSALGVIIGVYARTWDQIGSFTTFVFMPLSMLGGVFWSTEMLPGIWPKVSLLNPIYWMVNGMRHATLGIEENSQVLSLLLSLTFAVFFSFIAAYMFEKGYKIKS
tara:strand:+ start:65 stop:865 length:801 start_codon:yes stop_codon:yes gene_type:complete